MQRIARAIAAIPRQARAIPPAVVTDAAGKPLYSWRVSAPAVPGRGDRLPPVPLNRAWDHPSNRPLLDQMPAVFAAPRNEVGGERTTVSSLTGPGGLFRHPGGSESRRHHRRSLADDPARRGPGRGRLDPTRGRGVRSRPPAQASVGVGSSGFHAAMADGIVHYIPHPAATPALLRGLFTRAGGEMVLPP